MRKAICTLSLFIGIPVGIVAAVVIVGGFNLWLDNHIGPPPHWLLVTSWACGAGIIVPVVTLALYDYWNWCSKLCCKLRQPRVKEGE